MTVKEFNDEFVRSKFDFREYELLSNEDVGMYMAAIPNPQRLSLFCKWDQKSEPFDIDVEQIKII